MRLEDALLYVILDDVPAVGVKAFCEAAIAGGVDAIQVGTAVFDASAVVHEICERDDALFIVADDVTVATENEANGVHVSDAAAPVGHYRAMLGDGALVGMSTRNRNDALLALEMEADYLLHWEGALSASVFAALPGAAGNALFAAGLKGVEDAKAVVESGVYRLCLDSALLEGDDVTASAAAYSRILGRSI